ETAAETELAELSQEEADAQDEALLEMVAFEMAAPDPDDSDEFPFAESEPAHVTTPPVVEPLASVAREAEPELPQAEPQAPALQPSLSSMASVVPEPAVEPSLGSTIIARGILRKPSISANDPLAPIRRMSQAEKIAFFS